MAKFTNNKTGNTLTVKDAATIALMRKSDRYTDVKPKAAKTDKTPKAKVAQTATDKAAAE